MSSSGKDVEVGGIEVNRASSGWRKAPDWLTEKVLERPSGGWDRARAGEKASSRRGSAISDAIVCVDEVVDMIEVEFFAASDEVGVPKKGHRG